MLFSIVRNEISVSMVTSLYGCLWRVFCNCHCHYLFVGDVFSPHHSGQISLGSFFNGVLWMSVSLFLWQFLRTNGGTRTSWSGRWKWCWFYGECTSNVFFCCWSGHVSSSLWSNVSKPLSQRWQVTQISLWMCFSTSESVSQWWGHLNSDPLYSKGQLKLKISVCA